MKLLSLFLCALAVAAPMKKKAAKSAAPSSPVWTLKFPGERPSAAYFDITSGAIYVSLRDGNGEGGHLARVSLEGKLVKTIVARSKGPPGAMRSYDGRIYWLSGNGVQSYGPNEGTLSEGTIPAELGEPTDIAVARGPVVYVGMSNGTLVHLVAGAAPSEDAKGAPITGLFLLQDTLHVLRGGRLQEFDLSPSHDAGGEGLSLCAASCRGLERTSAGDWLTVSGSSVIAVNGKTDTKTLYSAPAGTALGRPAYVYHMDTKEDFFVLPFPALGELRAYRVNEGSK